MIWKLRYLTLGFVIGSILFCVVPAAAQVVTSSPGIQPRGQLGIMGQLTLRQEGRSTTTVVLVSGTRAGTPAHLAGVRRGDSIIGLNGRRLTVDRWAEFRAALEPGQEVHLTLLRNGQEREVLLEATTADPAFGFSTQWNIEIPDEVLSSIARIQETILEAFAAARLRYSQPEIEQTLRQADSTMQATLRGMREARREFSYSFRTGGNSDESFWVESLLRTDGRDQEAEWRVRTRGEEVERSVRRGLVSEGLSPMKELAQLIQGSAPLSETFGNATVVLRPSSGRGVFSLMRVVPLPVEFMRMDGEVADSLTGAYVILRSELAQIQEQRGVREMELVTAARLHSAEAQRSDGVLSSLNRETRRLFSRLADMEVHIRAFRDAEVGADANRYTLTPPPVVTEMPVDGTGRVLVWAQVGQPATIELAPPAASRVSARVVGQHFVMGAQLMPLNPRLSDYFDAAEGVLVVEVLEGTPAAEAGILPGDVILRVGRHAVREVQEVRRALAEGPEGLRFRIIRKGDTLTVRIGR